MSRWIYDGYTKVHDNSRKHMIEKWCYRCSDCGHIVRTEPKRTAILSYTLCPDCGADMRKMVLDEAVDGEGKDENVKEGERND